MKYATSTVQNASRRQGIKNKNKTLVFGVRASEWYASNTGVDTTIDSCVLIQFKLTKIEGGGGGREGLGLLYEHPPASPTGDV